MEKTYKNLRATKILGTIAAFACIAALNACSTVDSGAGDAGSGGGGSTEPTTSTSDFPLYIQVSSNFEGNTEPTVQGICNFTSADAPGPAVSKTCTIRIPELTLNISDLKFTIGTNSASTCTTVSFRPYYYIRSLANNYSPSGGADVVDCLTTPVTELACFGGAGPGIFGASFLTSKSRYFIPSNNLTQDYTLLSSNYTRQNNADNELSFQTTNTHAANLTDAGFDATATLTVADPAAINYVGNSLQDYRVTCNDAWANSRYEIILKIGDDNIGAGPQDAIPDAFWDWDDI